MVAIELANFFGTKGLLLWKHRPFAHYLPSCSILKPNVSHRAFSPLCHPQALTNENVAALMGLPSEGDDEEGSGKTKLSFAASRFVERMIRRMWHHREDVELNCQMLGCLEAMFKHSEETCRRVSA